MLPIRLGLLAAALLGAAVARADLASEVNPFVGTDNSGDTYPGAQAPFGMVQLSPDLRVQGYYYNEHTMHGFALTLMSGPGGANGGTPFFTATTGPVEPDEARYSYTYDHANESASAGYYRVLMQPSGINAELIATTRCGLARFTFPAGQPANVLLPISFANVPTYHSQVDRVDGHTLTGQVSSKPFNGPAKPIVVYFAMTFDQPFTTHGSWMNGQLTAGSDHVEQPDEHTKAGYYVSFPPQATPRAVTVRVGLSYVSVDGAMNNLKTEVGEAKFDDIHAQTTAAWNRELARIEIEGGTEVHRRVFYTAMYHAMLFPSIFDDCDGRYIGYDDVVRHVPAGHQHIYANYSGWDIYRSEWPLLTLIEPDRVADMAQSIVAMYQQLGYIDRWDEANRPTACMNGDPLTICLVHNYQAGITNFDITTAYEGMLKSARPAQTHGDLGPYEQLEDQGGKSLTAAANVSTAQEYCLSFAALGHLAQKLGKPDDADFLFGRALEYRSFYNPATGFFTPRRTDGSWGNGDGGRGFCEGDKYIYLWFVPHDVQGLVDLLGGSDPFEKRLDQFFDTSSADGHYDPTNEPDLQAPFLYDYINRPWKTQSIVARTADRVFTDEPGGLAGGGNDDLGEMSAWYILSQLGFYPVDPGVPYYETCTPRFPKATLHLGPGPGAKTFVIDAPAASAGNIYIQSATLNGAPLTKPWFEQSDVTGGGNLSVTVGPEPNRQWAASPFDRPYSLSCGFNYLPPGVKQAPLISAGHDGRTLWRYTTTAPGDNWTSSGFDDSHWSQGAAGFGTEDEGVHPATPWTSADIWMRLGFDLARPPTRAALRVYHDQGMEVYLNGQRVAHTGMWVHDYELIRFFSNMDPGNPMLHAGHNVLALHVHHDDDGRGGRHYADAHLIGYELP
ncbi:MAG TPA: GH92 family glycosyl hydrolase [Candidatus Methylacidiphilales bacterium]|nr:GH92 family glycosyl hydrolase [Candidatus Methylacidiphilales bacterium]